jgi:nitrogen fixation NifU-like protein
MDMYAEEIIAHYEHPHNKGTMEKPSATFHEYNPTCGDDLTIYLKIRNGKIEDAKFGGSGCAISIASASMLTEEIKGKTLGEIEGMGFKEIVEMLGIDPGPARLNCATLSLKAIKGAVFLYRHKEVGESTKGR